MQTDTTKGVDIKETMRNEIYKLSLLQEFIIPEEILQKRLINCFIQASIFLLQRFSFNYYQLYYIARNIYGQTSHPIDKIKTNSDLIRHLSSNKIDFGSLSCGMRNFDYILEEQKELSFSEVEHVRSLLNPLICHFVFRQEPLQLLIRKAELIYNEIRKTNAEIIFFKM